MKEKKHTPGPWIADLRTGCFAILKQTDKRTCLSGAEDDAIAFQKGRGEESSPGAYRYLTDEQVANARLIAAAPEMLAALEDVANELHVAMMDMQETGFSDGSSLPASLQLRLRDVIDKAKGVESC